MKAADVYEKDLSQKRLIGLIAVVLGFVICVGNVLAHYGRNAIYAVDFRSVYSSSRCLIVGCNPYSSSETMAEYLKQGGTAAETGPPPSLSAFVPYFPGYPPFTLFYFAPFALLRWPLAWVVYMVVATPLFFVALLLFARLCSDYTPLAANLMLGVFVALEGHIFMSAQPALLATSLCCIAVWCFLNDRFPQLSVFCFALSLALKPHLGCFVLLYFLLVAGKYRKRAWQTCALAILMCLPGLLWASLSPASSHWLQDYGTNLQHISSAGNLSDPGPTNIYASHIADLQAIASLIHNNPRFYNPVVWIFSLLLLITWAYAVIRLKPSREKDLICIAAIAAFTLLPLYHRDYDSRLLLLVFPALAVLWEKARAWGRAGLILTAYLTLACSDFYTAHSNPNSSLLLWTHNRLFWVILLERAVPLSCLLLVIFYLAFLYASAQRLKLMSTS